MATNWSLQPLRTGVGTVFYCSTLTADSVDSHRLDDADCYRRHLLRNFMGVTTKHDNRQQENVSSLFWVGATKPWAKQPGASFWYNAWSQFHYNACYGYVGSAEDQFIFRTHVRSFELEYKVLLAHIGLKNGV